MNLAHSFFHFRSTYVDIYPSLLHDIYDLFQSTTAYHYSRLGRLRNQSSTPYITGQKMYVRIKYVHQFTENPIYFSVLKLYLVSILFITHNFPIIGHRLYIKKLKKLIYKNCFFLINEFF